MNNHAPAEVLAARLGHELNTARIYAAAERPDMALRSIERAESVLAQLREALR
jgi:hypothetical protein